MNHCRGQEVPDLFLFLAFITIHLGLLSWGCPLCPDAGVYGGAALHFMNICPSGRDT